MNVRDAVEFVGNDDAEVYRGHPGRVVDVGQMPHEVSVSFVNGPSCCYPPEQLRRLPEAKYLARGRRLVSLMHPLDERPVARFNAEGEEWPDGEVARPHLG